ncbi:MAG: hypothetical protein ABIQ44_12465 [Chloroflexia bacterium]
MSERERMSSRASNGSRLSRSLHEDASRHIGNELNMWPQIQARINAEQEAAARIRGSLSARVEHEDIILRPSGSKHKQWREGSRQINFKRLLPAALMSLCMVVFLVSATLMPSSNAKPSSTIVDACSLITQSEVENLTGAPMEQFRWQPNMKQLVACAYFGKDEMMNVMVAHFSSEDEAASYLKSIRPDLIGGLETQNTQSSIGGYGGRRIDISGDEGFSNSRTPGNRSLNFWDVLVRQHNRYFIITWMTNAERPDPTNPLEDLARLVASRLPAR